MSRRTLWSLYAINLLNSIGQWFILPLLPIYLGRRGGSAALVGVVFAAGLLANAVVRYPAGWAADRYGTKPVLIASTAATALLFLAYLLPLPLGAFILVRLAQGLTAGAYAPAANGLIAAATRPEERGRAFGYMQATYLAGMIVGPGVGGLVALVNLGVVFAVAGGASALALVFLVGLSNVRAYEALEVPANVLHLTRRLLPLILLGAGTAYMGGAYDTIWSLYLTSRGASTFAVGFSFMAFALPAMFASGLAGWLSDRFRPRRVVVTALLSTALFAALYPFITPVPLLIAMGLPDGASTITGMPILVAEVSRISGPHEQGRTQGLFQTFQTAIQIVGALCGGALFTASHTAAFLAITTVCVLSAATALVRIPATTAVGQPTS